MQKSGIFKRTKNANLIVRLDSAYILVHILWDIIRFFLDFCNAFYFFVAQNKATNHAIPVQPNVQLAKRTRVISVLSFLVWRAIHAGVNIIVAIIAIAAAYFIPSKI